MLIQLKKILFAVSLNSFLFLLIIIVIQNSSNRSKVNLVLNETVLLPISFIIGTSFVSGTFLGSLLNIKSK